MGLDMYLYAEQYISGYTDSNFGTGFLVEDEPITPLNQQRKLYRDIVKFAGLQQFDDQNQAPHAIVHICIMYWRKVNAIHGWFVKNVQNGVDKCQLSRVSYQDLQKLLEQIKEAIAAYDNADKKLAEHILPPCAGFLFGSTDIDEYYREDLKYTQEKLEAILANTDKHTRFHYQSSW